ncbi:MAG: AlpA family phage regulatory protein [Sterolibacteriaceae bacterium]|nr:AlpA family phage regulatory protein [Sterolibacteriaceae bacterium]
MTTELPATSLVRLPNVIQITGLARSTIYKFIFDERFHRC